MQRSTSKLACGRVPGPWVNAGALEPRCYEKRKDRIASRSGFSQFLWGARRSMRWPSGTRPMLAPHSDRKGFFFLGLKRQSCNYRGPFGGGKERKNMEGA